MKATLPVPIRRLIYGTAEPEPRERHTLPRFLLGMVFQGIWWAGYLLIPFVLPKSLDASGGLITLAVTLDTGGMLLAIYWGHLLSVGPRRKILVWGGVLGRLILLATPLVGSARGFMALLVVVYLFGALSYPAQNGILQACFRPPLRGRIWGLGTSIQNLVAVATAIVMGRLLDHDPALFRSVYAVIGVCGFGYLLVLSRLPGTEGEEPVPAAPAPGAAPTVRTAPAAGAPALTPEGLGRALVRPFADAVTTFRRDRPYLWYEVNFMVYGLAFLMIYAMLPLLLADRLGLSYGHISTARVMIAQFGVAILAPVMGRVSDRHHPAGLCVLAFGVMALFPLGLSLAHDLAAPGGPYAARPEHLIYLVFAVYAVGMAGVNIGWNVGSISFAPRGEGARYQGIHVALVGVRGLTGPSLGYAIMQLAGMKATFYVATGLLLTASLSSAFLWRRVRR
jgi:MFS family permease